MINTKVGGNIGYFGVSTNWLPIRKRYTQNVPTIVCSNNICSSNICTTQYLFLTIFVPHNICITQNVPTIVCSTQYLFHTITIISVHRFPPKFKFRVSSQSVAEKRQKKFHETIRKVNYGYCMTLGCSAQNYTRHICERAIQ